MALFNFHFRSGDRFQQIKSHHQATMENHKLQILVNCNYFRIISEIHLISKINKQELKINFKLILHFKLVLPLMRITLIEFGAD
jgi:hypothetical protein